ncbi:hypothetical protein Mapa_008556 [Marchantia paleacea]|nr:hypothetical protein Mapa_008556 [Marchantia paleacea]
MKTRACCAGVGAETLIWRIVALCALSVVITSQSYDSISSYFGYSRSFTFSFPEVDLKLEQISGVAGEQSGAQHDQLKMLAMGRPRDKLDLEKRWNTWTTRAAEWRSNPQIQSVDPNWPGRERMHNSLKNGSLWWDEDFETHFLSELEQSQFPTDCKKRHVFAHRSHNAGLLSNVHVFIVPLLIGMLRGFTVLDTTRNGENPTYYGCPLEARNLGCHFNFTSCSIEEFYGNETTYKSANYVTWDYAVIQDEDSFPPRNVTLVEPFRKGRAGVCIDPIMYEDALSYYKVKFWHKLKKKGSGMVGIYGEKDRCTNSRIEPSRLDFLMISMLSGWMLSKTSERVKTIADNIMARYSDESGRPFWRPPVLGIHVRQTDKAREDPFWNKNKKYRDVSDFADKMREMEKEHGFRWPSLFLISDSGTAIESLASVINGGTGNESLSTAGLETVSSSTFPSQNSSNESTSSRKRLIMYDWHSDTHLLDNYGAHNRVPEGLKRESQEHFIATLYIFSRICDYSIVTYSSNVGRFLGEITASQHRLVNPGAMGPVTMSLDNGWGRD